MKKIITLVLIAALTFTLIACGAEKIIDVNVTTAPADTAAIRENFDKTSAFVEANIDTKDMEVQTDEESESYLYKYWFATEEDTGAEFSKDIDIDGNTVTIGKTIVKDLESFGMDIEKTADTVQPDEIIGITLSKNNKFFSLSVSTPSSEAAPIDDCVITEASAMNNDYSIDFTYSGLSKSSTLKDVIDALGKPNSSVHISSDEISNSIELSYYSQTAEEGVITDYNLTVYLNYDPAADSADISTISLSCDSHAEAE